MVEIYTDGGCRGNPGPGGYGVVAIEEEKILYTKSLSCEETTNNIEELKAIICALAYVEINGINDFIIYSDSAYCVNMINDWIWKWANNDWINSKGEVIKNLCFVKCLYQFLIDNEYKDKIVKIKGHNGIAGNELADALATNNYEKYIKIINKYSLIDVTT